MVEGVGLYVPKPGRAAPGHGGLPSRRYLGLLRAGAVEAGLDPAYVRRLEQLEHYVTPARVREQTRAWIAEFEADPARSHALWSAAELAEHDGSDPERPAHTAVLGYVVKVHAMFPSWRGHTVTRRNLVHFNGHSVDAGDIRHDQPGFLPLPDLSRCSADELEFLAQNLDHLVHQGGTIVARLREFLDAQA